MDPWGLQAAEGIPRSSCRPAPKVVGCSYLLQAEGKPVACNLAAVFFDFGLLWGKVACCFWATWLFEVDSLSSPLEPTTLKKDALGRLRDSYHWPPLRPMTRVMQSPLPLRCRRHYQIEPARPFPKTARIPEALKLNQYHMTYNIMQYTLICSIV